MKLTVSGSSSGPGVEIKCIRGLMVTGSNCLIYKELLSNDNHLMHLALLNSYFMELTVSGTDSGRTDELKPLT